MSFVTRGLDWLQTQLASAAGLPIVYRTRAGDVEIPDAVMGQSQVESQDVSGLTVRSSVIDWLVDTHRLTVDDQLIEPQPGDHIRQTVGDITRVFEVQAMGQDPCWRYSGPGTQRLRIHTREITA